MDWPLESVKLSDGDLNPVDEWIGYLVPRYLAGLPNVNSTWRYRLEFGCRYLIELRPGDLEKVIWEVLMVHESWCLSR